MMFPQNLSNPMTNQQSLLMPQNTPWTGHNKTANTVKKVFTHLCFDLPYDFYIDSSVEIVFTNGQLGSKELYKCFTSLQKRLKVLAHQSTSLCRESNTTLQDLRFLQQQSKHALSEATETYEKSLYSLYYFLSKLKEASRLLVELSVVIGLAGKILTLGRNFVRNFSYALMNHSEVMSLLLLQSCFYVLKGVIICLRYLYGVKAALCFNVRWIAVLQSKSFLNVALLGLRVEKCHILIDLCSVCHKLLLLTKEHTFILNKKILILSRGVEKFRLRTTPRLFKN